MKFSDKELMDMKMFYERELSNTLIQLNHIKTVLQKIDDDNSNVPHSEPIAAYNSLDFPEYTLPRNKRKPARKGPRSHWPHFVISTLKKVNKPLTYDELIGEAVKYANVGLEGTQKIRQTIINVTFKLRTQEQEIDTFSKGNRIKYIALISWFDKDGKILPEYANKASEAKPKATKKKVLVKK
jgi:hypothetical protein